MALAPAQFASTTFDYLIAGGGTAGLTLAARLSENPKVQVGVIEAGKDHTTDPLVLNTALVLGLWDNPEYDWIFKTTPQVRSDVHCPHDAFLKWLHPPQITTDSC